MTTLILITGFLGAGKTTLLRSLLPLLKENGLRVRVILNDYANADLDSASLKDLVPDIQSLTGSCVCCNSMDDFLGLLREIPEGSTDVVLVEANGTTDPLPLMETLALSDLRLLYPILHQLVLVDAHRWQNRGPHNRLERMQVETATHCIMTWTDQVATSRRMEVQQELESLNPRMMNCTVENFARQLQTATQSSVAGVLALRSRNPFETSVGIPVSSGPWLAGNRKAGPSFLGGLLPASGVGSKSLRNHALSHHFMAFKIPLPRALHPLQLVGWLESLPTSVIRAKGVVSFLEQPGRYHIFQRVDDSVSFRESLMQPVDGCCQAILVGVGLEENDLQNQAQTWFQPRIQ